MHLLAQTLLVVSMDLGDLDAVLCGDGGASLGGGEGSTQLGLVELRECKSPSGLSFS